MAIRVFGAGLSGLIAGAMLRDECLGVHELGSKLPNNHSAVLRFRSRVVADVLNLPFKEVEVMKAIAPWRNPVADALSYSMKTNGGLSLRSIASAEGRMETRWIAPPDLIARLGRIVGPITFNSNISDWVEHKDKDLFGYSRGRTFGLISTIPMPALMKILNWPEEHPDFNYAPGQSIRFRIENCDAYCSLYVPDPKFAFSRISITGDELIAECHGPSLEEGQVEETSRDAMAIMGVNHSAIASAPEVRNQRYSKIKPIDEDTRRRFITWASDVHGIYSLGRFATWRPRLLLDDVVNDVRVIGRMIASGTSYEQRK